MAEDLLVRARLAIGRLKDEGLSDEARLAAFNEAEGTMRRLVSDVGAPEIDRLFAWEWLKALRAHLWMALPEVVADMAELAGTAKDPEIRREALEMLAAVSRRLRERGMDIGRWQTGTGETRQ